MSYQDFPPALMILSPRLTKAGDPGSSVVGLNTTPLADGAVVYCIEAQLAYRLDKQSTAAPDGNLVLAPLNGPGRWLAASSSGPTVNATPTTANKGMTAATTTVDGDLACPTPVALTPASSSANGGYIGVGINPAFPYIVGDGTKVGVDCYFSGDGGVTARLLRDVVAGDFLYWNMSVAGFNLDATKDQVSFFYDVSS